MSIRAVTSSDVIDDEMPTVQVTSYSRSVASANIRVGLLAYGAIGHEHNLAVQNTSGLELTAVCDTNPDRVKAALELAPQATAFDDATEMLDSGLLDLVVISTPPNTHYQWAKESLSRGVHVVLEKPMALTAEQCDELIGLASNKKLLLVVYQNRRYDASRGHASTGTPTPKYRGVRSSTGAVISSIRFSTSSPMRSLTSAG